MLASLGKFIVRIADLAEAEGRLAARHIVQLGTVLVTVLAAAALGVAALLVLAYALYLTLVAAGMHPALATGLTGLLLAIVSAGVGFAAFSLNQKPVHRPPVPPTHSPMETHGNDS
jgi:hypothetical protein